MWIVAILSLLNAGLNNDIVNSDALRIEIFHLPMNVFDMGLGLALVWSMLPGGDSRFATDRVSKVFLWTIGMFAVALLTGTLGSLKTEISVRYIVNDVRNMAMGLVAIIVGYRSTKNLGSAYFYCYVVVIAGILTATMIPLDFARGVESLGVLQHRDVENVRIIQYMANYGGLAAGILIFCLGFKGKPMMPRWLGACIAGYCTLGACATLSRSDWVSIAAGLIAAVAIMPRLSMTKKVGLGIIIAPVLLGFLLGGMYVAQRISGRDVFSKMTNRLWSIVGLQNKGNAAEDSRWPAIVEELRMWSSSPITVVVGGGFGVHEAAIVADSTAGQGGFRHNTWVSTLAETGLIGFTAMSLMVFGQIVVGFGMVRRRLDRRTIIVGALGVITGVHFIVHGLTTMSFNMLRPVIPLALMCGVVFRTRAIERTLLTTYAGYLPDPKDPRAPATPLLDAGTSKRPPSILVSPGESYTDRAAWAGQGREEYAHY